MTSKVKYLLVDNYPYQVDLPFLWMGVISHNFEDSENSPILRELFIHLQRTCGNILFPCKILKGCLHQMTLYQLVRVHQGHAWE